MTKKNLIFAAILLLGYVGLSHQECWTKWYNRDTPDGTGDWEDIGDLRRENPGEICNNPLGIQVVTVDDGTPAEQTGQIFYIYSASLGFVCRNTDQPSGICRDYKVSFLCPCFMAAV